MSLLRDLETAKVCINREEGEREMKSVINEQFLKSGIGEGLKG